MDKHLTELYTDASSVVAFTAADTFYKYVKRLYPKLTLGYIKRFLQSQDSYTLHKPSRRRFKRNRVISDGLHEQYDLDLADVSSRAKANSGINFLLIAIDVFSRYAYVEPLRNKAMNTVVKGMENVLHRMGEHTPKSVRNDAGTEFLNKSFKRLLNRYGIKQYVSRSSVKANYAERFIRTLKNKMARYRTQYNTKRDIDYLQKAVSNYNNTYHSSIEMRPSDVSEANESALWSKLYLNPSDRFKTPYRSRKHKLKEGQQVRIAINKKPFEKGYTPNWSETIYLVSDTFYREDIPIYRITDLLGRPIKTTYYEEQLEPVNVNLQKKRIAKILQTRRKGRNTEYHVRWMYYGPTYDTWMPLDKLKEYII